MRRSRSSEGNDSRSPRTSTVPMNARVDGMLLGGLHDTHDASGQGTRQNATSPDAGSTSVSVLATGGAAGLTRPMSLDTPAPAPTPNTTHTNHPRSVSQLGVELPMPSSSSSQGGSISGASVVDAGTGLPSGGNSMLRQSSCEAPSSNIQSGMDLTRGVIYCFVISTPGQAKAYLDKISGRDRD